jgi:hypothetical protein
MDDADQNHDDGEDEQQMDESPKGVGTHQAEDPQDQQYDRDDFKHDVSK